MRGEGAGFSVITAVRNGLPMIKGCVASVHAQGDWVREHLIQDALSPDGTAAWCASQPGIDVRSEADAGMYDAIARGWARAGGEYLSWLNADEQYLPGSLASVATAFSLHPEVDVIFGDAIIVDPKGRPIAYRREPVPRSLYIRNSFLYVYSCTLFYRRRLWDSKILKLDTSLRYAADMDLILNLLQCGVRFMRLERPLALFTASGENLSTHNGMRQENEYLQQRYGAAASGFVRGLTRIPRWIERLLIGGFSRRSGNFPFYCETSSDPLQISYAGLGTRYSVFDSRGGQGTT